jgi:hypothetical protein
MQPWRDGLYRCMLTTSSPAAISFGACIVGSINALRNRSSALATSIIYVACPQVEGPFATSYITTATATVTRAGDFACLTGPNFTSWYNPIQGTFGAQFQTIYPTDTIIRNILTGNENQLMYLNADTGTLASFDGQEPPLLRAMSASGKGYNLGGRALSVLGSNASFSSISQNLSLMTSLHIGHLVTQLVPLCGWIKSLVYYPIRLTSAELKTLST